jgi:hypothetical protein
VLLASAAPTGIVIRRGPASSVCTLLWDRQKDEFQVGQWLRGRIYERRADISPDGKHWIYFARGSSLRHAETRGSWTAIARSPWLKALTLYGKGDCWLGGGLFLSPKRYWLNGCHELIRDSAAVKIDAKFSPSGGPYGGECPSVYYRRLQRDGWLMEVERINCASDRSAIFQKELPHGWILRKFARADIDHPQGSGCYWDEHELENPKRGLRFDLTGWEWVELDNGSLVWAQEGLLKRASFSRDGVAEPRTLCDLNAMRFERRQAPY